jgi:FixJ family two-component response regulator
VKTATVFIVDDEAGVRNALARVFRSAGLQTAVFPSANEFLASFDSEAPGCLVLDLAMPGLNGIELQRALDRIGSPLPIVFLTGHATVSDSVQAMKGGAVDFLTKPVEDDVLLEAVRAALERDAEARASRSELDEIRERLSTLTPREREVLQQVVCGRLNKQIAHQLGTVEKTIKVHRARVMKKMQAGSLAELVRMAERLGI